MTLSLPGCAAFAPFTSPAAALALLLAAGVACLAGSAQASCGDYLTIDGKSAAHGGQPTDPTKPLLDRAVGELDVDRLVRQLDDPQQLQSAVRSAILTAARDQIVDQLRP